MLAAERSAVAAERSAVAAEQTAVAAERSANAQEDTAKCLDMIAVEMNSLGDTLDVIRKRMVGLSAAYAQKANR